MIERISFWGIPEVLHLATYVVLFGAAFILLIRLFLRVRLWWKVGRDELRWDRLHIRLWNLIKYGIAQIKTLREAYPGIMHVAIAWAFFVFFAGTGLATIDDHFIKFLNGPVYLVFKLVLDGFTVIALFGMALAAYRRFAQKPSRLTLTSPFAWSLILIFLIVLTGLLTESLRLAAVAQDPLTQPGWEPANAWWAPAGWITAQLWLALGLTPGVLTSIHLGVWILHVGLVVTVFITLPVGSLMHIITAPLNVFFSKLDRPLGRLAPAPQLGEGLTGVASLKDFTWKQLMDGDACTECGRCQDACPAYAAGMPLSPKEVILAIKTSMDTDAAALIKGGNGRDLPSFTGDVVREDVLWSCSTCGACVAACPVMIEHVDSIVDMRRYLLAKGQADNLLMTALMNVRRYGNSFGQSERKRAMWTRDIKPRIKDIRKQPAHTFWFVGDYASYNPALRDATIATARVFQAAGIDFGLAYDGERNAGNDVRRVGEEGLFEMLAFKNKAVIEKLEYEQIVTTDPHTYNTLKNEYDLDGNGRPVYHYSEVLDEAIAQGRLLVKKKLGYTVTYHDPCYLGRYNGIYDAPRRVLETIGCKVVEMPRNRENALCCAGGGGRIWMEEEGIQERPSENRIHEALKLDGVQCLVVTCPKDYAMYSDAVKTVGKDSGLVVKDLIELVAEASLDPVSEEATSLAAQDEAAAPLEELEADE